MITLSPSLVNAMRSREGRPCVRAVVMDTQWRWSTVLQTEGSSLQTAAVETASGEILRARITAAGKVEVQTVEQPWLATSWESSWYEITDDATEGADVALARRPGADDLRLFYTKLSDSTYYLRCVESGDDGTTWGTATDVCSSTTEVGSLAASSSVIFYLRNGEVRRRWKPWTGGAWGSEATWEGCGQLAEDSGLAAVLHDGVHHVAVAGKWGDERRLRTGTYSGGTGWSTEVHDVVPPGAPAPDYCPRWPSLTVVDGAMYMGYLDTYEGTPSYSVPVVISTPDWDHWGCACALDLSWQTLKRLNVVYNSAETSLFAAMELDAVGSREYDASDHGRKLVEHDVAFYQIDVGEGYGYMLVDIVNRAGRYDDFGQSGKEGEAIKPLSEVVVERGYRTSVGDEYVASSPFYLVKASHRVGVGRPALRLLCVDGWGLMGRWEVDQSYAWSDKSIRWLITELVSRSTGLECQFDDSTEWSTVIPEFALHPRGWAAMNTWRASERGTGMPTSRWTGTAIQGVNVLLKKVGGRARWDQQGRLRCTIPSNQSIADWHSYGQSDEIIEGEYGLALVAPNVMRVIGDGTGWQAMHLSQGQAVGRRLMGIAVDLHLDEWTECQAMASGMWDRAAAGEYDGWLEVHLNPGQELWDFASVTDARCGYSAAMRRVAGICEVWNSAKRRYSSVLRLEGT